MLTAADLLQNHKKRQGFTNYQRLKQILRIWNELFILIEQVFFRRISKYFLLSPFINGIAAVLTARFAI